MEHKIKRGNWEMDLADKLESCEDGDTIICHSEEMIQFGMEAS